VRFPRRPADPSEPGQVAPNLIETNIGPPELFAGAKARGQLTEIKDLLEAVIKYFLLPSSKLSGHLLGGNGADLELRAIPAFFSEHAEKNAEVRRPAHRHFSVLRER
jgi:hypothetical protein